MTVSEAFETSIGEAIAAGLVDPTRQAAPIAVARKLARVMDTPEWPMVDGKYDNVSPSSFLKYCQELKLFESGGNLDKKSALGSIKLMAGGKKAANA